MGFGGGTTSTDFVDTHPAIMRDAAMIPIRVKLLRILQFSYEFF